MTRLGYTNATIRCGDGYHGWPEHAPFDAIIVAAAPEKVPPALLEQLKVCQLRVCLCLLSLSLCVCVCVKYRVYVYLVPLTLCVAHFQTRSPSE